MRSRWAAPSGFIEPCLPSRADRPPSGPGWVHEIKHDGFRMMVRRDVSGIRLLTRNGKDGPGASPTIVDAASSALVVKLDFSPAPASDAAAALAPTATDCGDPGSLIIRRRLSPAAH